MVVEPPDLGGLLAQVFEGAAPVSISGRFTGRGKRSPTREATAVAPSRRRASESEHPCQP
jgi:hypothetical protein